MEWPPRLQACALPCQPLSKCVILERGLHLKAENLNCVSAYFIVSALILGETWASVSSSINGDNNAFPT